MSKANSIERRLKRVEDKLISLDKEIYFIYENLNKLDGQLHDIQYYLSILLKNLRARREK